MSMEIEIKTTDLRAALVRAKGVAKGTTTMPILGAVKLEAKGEHLTVSATDLEVGLTTRHNAKVKNPGAVCVDANLLANIASGAPGEVVRLAPEKAGWIKVTSQRTSYRLATQPADAFPAMESAGDVQMVSIEAPVLASMVERTLYAASTDETRYNLCGVHMEALPSGLRLVSTDGHRMAIVERVLGAAPVLPQGGVTLPSKGLSVLRRLLGEVQGAVHLGLGKTLAVVELGDVRFTMRLVDGAFPSWEQVVPAESSAKGVVRVERDALTAALKRASIMSSDKITSVKVTVAPGEALVLLVSNPDKGEVREEIAVEYEGPEMKFGVNGRYLAEAAGAVSEGSVEVRVIDELAPVGLRGAGAKDYRAVVMPMRV